MQASHPHLGEGSISIDGSKGRKFCLSGVSKRILYCQNPQGGSLNTQVSEVNQPFAGAALVAVRNQWSEDLVDIIVDNVGCGRPQGPPLQGITALLKLE